MKAGRFALAAVFLLAAHAATAQTADDIIEKSIAAMGGRAALEKIKTRVVTGDLSIGTPVGDIAGTVEMYGAAPNKQRTVIKADLSSLGAGPLVIDQRFDGTTGYAMDTMQGNREITGTQLDNMKAQGFPHPFLNYKAAGSSVKLGAKEQVQGKDMYVLTFEPPAGLPIKQYVDATTFLPARTIVTADVPQMTRSMTTRVRHMPASGERLEDGPMRPVNRLFAAVASSSSCRSARVGGRPSSPRVRPSP